MEDSGHNSADRPSSVPTEAPSDVLSDQAIEWLARMRATDVTAAEKADFAAWLALSDAHRAAFDDAASLWELSARLDTSKVDLTQPEAASTSVRRRPWLPLAAAASVAALCLTMLVQLMPVEYRTGKGEQQRVVLNDGSIAFLNTDSELKVDYSDDARALTLLRGEAWFDVAHAPDRPFTVATEHAAATALGTAFNVRIHEAFTRVGVSEGRVGFRLQNDEAITLTAGEMGTGADGYLHKERFDPQSQLAWRQGQLVYDNVPLHALISDLNRYFDRVVSINDEDLAQRRVSAVLFIDDQDAMLDALSTALPIQWKLINPKLVIITEA